MKGGSDQGGKEGREVGKGKRAVMEGTRKAEENIEQLRTNIEQLRAPGTHTKLHSADSGETLTVVGKGLGEKNGRRAPRCGANCQRRTGGPRGKGFIGSASRKGLVMRDFEGWKEAGRRRTKGLWFLSGSKGASSVRDSYSCHSLRVAYI